MTDYKNELEQIFKKLNGSGAHACYCERSTDKGCECALKDEYLEEAIASIEALLSQHSKKRELEALQSLRDKRTIVEMDLDMEWPYWCENCTMCLEQEDDMCACIALTKDRIKQLTNGEGK